MDIEEVIKQKTSFTSNRERALVNMLFTQGWISGQLRVHLSKFCITPKQYNILRILQGGQKAMSIFEIRERMLDKMSDITRLIDRMILKGWVSKEVNLKDRRLVDIQITDGGRSLLDQVKSSQKPIWSVLKNLTEPEAVQLNQLLDKIRKDQ